MPQSRRSSPSWTCRCVSERQYCKNTSSFFGVDLAAQRLPAWVESCQPWPVQLCSLLVGAVDMS
jgi:hypothetical protein